MIGTLRWGVAAVLVVAAGTAAVAQGLAGRNDSRIVYLGENNGGAIYVPPSAISGGGGSPQSSRLRPLGDRSARNLFFPATTLQPAGELVLDTAAREPRMTSPDVRKIPMPGEIKAMLESVPLTLDTATDVRLGALIAEYRLVGADGHPLSSAKLHQDYKSGKSSILQIVQDEPNPVVVPSAPSAADSPQAYRLLGPCTRENQAAALFLSKFSTAPRSVASVVRISAGKAELIGMAAIIPGGLLLSAGHVVWEVAKQRVDSSFYRVREAGRRYYLLFDIQLDEFPEGLPQNLDWVQRRGTVRIPEGTLAYVNLTEDIGFLSLTLDRGALPLDAELPERDAVVALLGVPAKPQGVDSSRMEALKSNFEICRNGVPVAVNTARWPIQLRLGTGRFIGCGNSNEDCARPEAQFEHKADTLGGVSGSPIFSLISGGIIGINVGTPNQSHAEANLGRPLPRILHLLQDMQRGVAVGGF